MMLFNPDMYIMQPLLTQQKGHTTSQSNNQIWTRFLHNCTLSEQPDAGSQFAKEGLNIQVTQEHCYIIGFIGSPIMNQSWLYPTR